MSVYSAAGAGGNADGSKSNSLWWAHVAYHGGRGLTYAALGALGGAAGAAIDWAGEAAGLVRVAAFVSGGLVILWGLGVLFPALKVKSPLERFLGRSLVKLRTKPRVFRASLLGALTPMLPCGWLYAFVVTAAGTASLWEGATVMTVFWLGTIPALLGVGVLAGSLGGFLRRRAPLVTGVSLIVVGLFAVLSRSMAPLPVASAGPTAPHGEHDSAGHGEVPSGEHQCH